MNVPHPYCPLKQRTGQPCPTANRNSLALVKSRTIYGHTVRRRSANHDFAPSTRFAPCGGIPRLPIVAREAKPACRGGDLSYRRPLDDPPAIFNPSLMLLRWFCLSRSLSPREEFDCVLCFRRRNCLDRRRLQQQIIQFVYSATSSHSDRRSRHHRFGQRHRPARR